MADEEFLSPRQKELMELSRRPRLEPQDNIASSSSAQQSGMVTPILYHNTPQNRMLIRIFYALGVVMLVGGVAVPMRELAAMGVFFLVFTWFFTRSSGITEALSGDGAPALACEGGMITGYLAHPVPIHDACFSIYRASGGALHVRFESPGSRPQSLNLTQFVMADGSDPNQEKLERVLLGLGIQKAPELSLREAFKKISKTAKI